MCEAAAGTTEWPSSEEESEWAEEGAIEAEAEAVVEGRRRT